MRLYFMTYKRALLLINTRHLVLHCSCQNSPENIQKSGFSTTIISKILSIPFRHLCGGSIIVTKQTPLFPLGNQEVTRDIILHITTGRRSLDTRVV